MQMGPQLLLDKSSFESLSRPEHFFLFAHFLRVLPPVLVAEVVADLTKTDSSARSPEELVARLADKFVGSGPPLHVGHWSLLRNDLMAADIVMDGRSYPASARQVPDRGHGPGVIIDISPTNRDIMRWARGDFHDGDREVADSWRNSSIPFPADTLEASIHSRGATIPRLTTIEAVRAWVDEMIGNADLGSLWLDWLIEKARLSVAARAGVTERWLRHRVPLGEFSPYGLHCMKTDLSFIGARRAQLFADRPTNLIDVQYLYYTPFCMAFVSTDRLHRVLAPLLLRPDQDFVWGAELKADIASRLAERPTLDEAARKRRAWVYGGPDPRRGSVVTKLWLKLCRITLGNLAFELSPEEQKKALQERRAMFARAGINLTDAEGGAAGPST
jgi:hypothetical protein